MTPFTVLASEARDPDAYPIEVDRYPSSAKRKLARRKVAQVIAHPYEAIEHPLLTRRR